MPGGWSSWGKGWWWHEMKSCWRWAHWSNIQTAKWCHRAAARRPTGNYCEIPGHHLQPAEGCQLTDVRRGERCLRVAFAMSPGENNVSGAASRFVGSKFVFESPSTVWPLALWWGVGGWSCFASLSIALIGKSVYGGILWRCMAKPPYGGRALWQLQLKEENRGSAIIVHRRKVFLWAVGHLVAILWSSHLTPHGVRFPIGAGVSPPLIGFLGSRSRPSVSSVPHWPASLPPLTRLATAPRGLIHSVFSLSRIRIPVIVVDSVWPRRYNYNTRSGPAVEPGSRDASRDCLCPARG